MANLSQHDYRTYRVQAADRQPLLDFMFGALRNSGCRILGSTPPNEAPFRFVFETDVGERIGVVAYAFLANQKETTHRPADEHRFQLKYGPKTDELHSIWQDPFELYTTILLGINPEGKFFVGVDPQMHNPTKFYISIEFKDAEVSTLSAKGWHAWERQRHFRGVDGPVEVLVGGTAEQFLRYIQFERLARGLDQGNRRLLSESKDWFGKTQPLGADGEIDPVNSHP